MKDGLIVHVMRPAGSAVCRLHFRGRHLVVLGVLLAAVCGALYAFHASRLQAASVAVTRLQAQRVQQQRTLESMERQTQALQKQNIDSARSIERIERTLGAQRTGSLTKPVPTHGVLPRSAGPAALAARLALLARAAAQTQAQTHRLARLAKRILNLRRLASIARARTLAAIPSLNPVGGGINAAFGWRTDPFPEFHKGLDLAADYGATVHAAAAGTVASAGWEGGYGIKIDVDHGNGYHTWYCHLSRLAVSPGQRVARGEPIGAVGSTGESTGPHLHYQVMHDGVAIDPMPFLRGVPPNVLATLPATADVH
jgi:murein DD-endopeptidase MepM/ murein hydrolase activator NlpD